jgi:hypothetical protein
MATTNVPPTGPAEDHERVDRIIAEYEFARESRSQADATAWEMTAIIWGGQTLLLGFVLEAIDSRFAQPLIMLLAVLGVLSSIFNEVVMKARRTVAVEMVKVCSEAEDLLPGVLKPQHRLDIRYERGIQRRWFITINLAFVVIWVLTGLGAVFMFCHHLSRV